MHRDRRRDAHERFLPNDPNPNKQLVEFQNIPRDEEEEENPFVDAFPNLTSFETSFEEHIIQNLIENPFALTIHQEIMVIQNQNRPNQPSFPFPITHQNKVDNLLNIPALVHPKFYGLVIEDPDTLFFEFDILYKSYDYTIDAHRLKLFPTPLKEVALRWFMGLGRNTVETRWYENNVS